MEGGDLGWRAPAEVPTIFADLVPEMQAIVNGGVNTEIPPRKPWNHRPSPWSPPRLRSAEAVGLQPALLFGLADELNRSSFIIFVIYQVEFQLRL